MVVSELCIRRPVFATVLSLVVLLVGLVSYDRLSVREYPAIDEPVVNVDTRYRGASSEIVESQITRPLEDALSGIEGIEYLSSISRAERSQITIRFRLARDADAAANDVRDRVGRTRDDLPRDVDEPIIAKVEADAQPIMYLAFSSEAHSPLEVTDYADRVVKDRLQTLAGVADVPIYGERRYAMRIWLDRARLAAYRLTPQDVEDALRRQNVEVPSGRIESAAREFTVLTETDLETPAEFEQIVLRAAAGYMVRLKDVGRAEIGAADERVIARFNGRSAVALGVVKQSTANPLEVSAAVRAALPGIVADLPDGMRVDVAYDSSVFIKRSIEEVFRTIGEAVALVMAVIFLFLRSVRATIIPLVTIPVSLIGSFALILAFGFSINTLTLLALVLAIGLVVDDAIVVLENSFRHVEGGLAPRRAAVKGIREIGFAVVAMTLTLAAVFAPIGFATGRTGQLFAEFALTLAGAVLISGFVALTLSPMMCSLMLRHRVSHGVVYNAVERALRSLFALYRRALTSVLSARAAVLVLVPAVAFAGYQVFAGLDSELAPIEDRGILVGIAIGPDGSTVESTDVSLRRIEEIYARVPEQIRYFAVAGRPVVSQAITFLGLKPWEERRRSSFEIAESLRPEMFAIPGMLVFPVTPPSLGQSVRGSPVQIVLQTTGSYAELQALVERVLAEARGEPGLINLDTDLKLNLPEIKVDVDRDKAADLGVEVEAIGRTLETMLGGRQVTRFKQRGDQYDVIVRVADVERTNPSDVTSIYVRGERGAVIQLANLVRIGESVAPRELNHFNKLRAVTLTANLAPGTALGEALKTLEDTVQRVAGVPVSIDYGGVSREFKQSSATLYVTFLLALAFIYLVLAAQFESFLDPLIIMLTVPLAMTGALAALALTGGTLNVYSQIGLVTLVGLITKHGILIVEFANQLRAQGHSARDAVIESATLRLRPILMTTGAMVLGAVPLALASGAGAESRRQIGWVIVGGLLFGTLLTLFVVPAAYALLSRRPQPAEKAATQGAPAE